jgi:hypothetical protein
MERIGNIRSNVEELKSIPIHDLFYQIVLDTVNPLHEIKNGNKYILVAILHYSKWCKVKVVPDHIAIMIVKFLEDEIICQFGVPKCILTNNGGDWVI